MHIAVENGNVDIIRLLLQNNKIDINIRDKIYLELFFKILFYFYDFFHQFHEENQLI